MTNKTIIRINDPSIVSPNINLFVLDLIFDLYFTSLNSIIYK